MKLILDFFWIRPLKASIYFIGQGKKVYLVTFSENKVKMFLDNKFDCRVVFSKKKPLLIREELHAYFKGELKVFSSEPVIENSTFLERRVWDECRCIPYGETISYKELGEKVLPGGKLARFVGNVMRKNNILLVIPCHRVIRSDGKIGGFSCGEDKKRFLLTLEKGE